MNVLIVGASRGIGLEFVRQYRAAGAHVTATARDEAGLERLRALGADAIALDVTDAASCAGLAWPSSTGFDVAVYNAGVYGRDSTGLEAPEQDDFDAVMHANVLGAMRVLPRLRDVLARDAKLAVISSRMGSIGERAGTVGWLYRASKAAVNSVLKDVSITFAGRATCVAFHPGWVRTDMGGAGADLSVEESVTSLRGTIASLTAKQHGRFLNHDGSPIAW